MHDIASRDLMVTIFDPIEDRERFSPRFVTGGYIFRVTDRRNGKILTSGPTWGEGFVPFHGEGMPETFHRIPLYVKGEDCHIIPGIGKCDLDRDEITEPCVWKSEFSQDSCRFETRETAGGFDFTLIREVKVDGRNILSSTEIVNHGPELLPVCWYPHPFIPPVKIGETMYEVDGRSRLLADSGYFSLLDGRIKRVPGVDQELSFQPMEIKGAECTEAIIHSSAGYDLYMKTDFRSDFVPVWANDRTCSVEPYLDCMVFPGLSRKWSVSYGFLMLKEEE